MSLNDIEFLEEDDDLEELLKLAVEEIPDSENNSTQEPQENREQSSNQKYAGLAKNGEKAVINNEVSTIGEDILDSSEDEDVRNFLERKYNQYGSEINKKLKQNESELTDSRIKWEVNKDIKENTDKSKEKIVFKKFVDREAYATTARQSNGNNTVSATKISCSEQEKKCSIYTDPVFGFRLIKPLISSTILLERMMNKKLVTFSSIGFHIMQNDLSKDWVIAGIILSKSPVKTTKTGASYSIWKLTDLRDDNKTISLFLFKNAHKELWKIPSGMVAAILNPNVFNKNEQRGDVACLSIDCAQKVMILGQSKDIGVCKAKKKNGEPCGATVNLATCEYCIYHIQQEYNSMSKRSELQAKGGGLTALRNKVLGKSEVFYGGQSFTSIPAKKNPKLIAKEAKRLLSLSEYYQNPNAGSINHQSMKDVNTVIPYAKSSRLISKVAANIEVNSKQRLKDLERLKVLNDNNDDNMENKHISETKTNTQDNSPNGKFNGRQFSLQKTPTLSRENFSVEINITPSARRAELAKLKAAEILKIKPVDKSNPNFIKYRGTAEGKKRAITELSDNSPLNGSKRIKIDYADGASRNIDNEKKNRIEKIMKATSSHLNLIEQRENEQQEKYFNKLEKKEALEEKMLNTYKIPCKAVICYQCKYSAFSAADRCKEEKHRLKVIDAIKSFFQCEDCGNRTATIHRLPKMSCKNCQSSRWKRTSMIKEKRTDLLGAPPLSIRGDEEKFLGSLSGSSSGMNLNLLVPEE